MVGKERMGLGFLGLEGKWENKREEGVLGLRKMKGENRRTRVGE